jgi:anti-sigma regulatory factor (Ser/Thr protein kinase)
MSAMTGVATQCGQAHAAEWQGPVREAIDVFAARWAVQRLAAQAGFPVVAATELAIVVSELATNILKYGDRDGTITMRIVENTSLGAGLEIIAEDAGPPLANLECALRDGWDDRGPLDPSQLRRGGIGAGLGAVRRLTDVFEYHPAAARKSFRVIRFLRRPRQSIV